MHFHQFYLNCLAHASYLVGDADECAIVDPQRDVEQYIAAAAQRGMRIRFVIETHIHADFVSGHRELAARTGAEIVIGASANAGFPHREARDGDSLALGGIELVALATPGHTPESISWLVVDGVSPVKVLTGDTLFIGDVGRPDLAGSRGYTPETMAGMLFDSLHGKLLTLPDAVEVWPAHGAGSACGRNISTDTSSTIGQQRLTNYAVQPMPREEFVRLMTADLPAAPPYFAHDAEMNRAGARPLAEVSAPRLSAAQAAQRIEEGAVAVDVRDAAAFGAGHLPGSFNIGLGGQFASWCGTLLSFDDRFVIVADGEEQSHEAVMRLARVGLENIAGWVDGGVAAWSGSGYPCGELPQLSPGALRDQLDSLQIVDVRNPGEYESGHVPGARNIPLNQLSARLSEIDPTAGTALICAGGYRSSTAASLLARSGFADLRNVTGGTAAWVLQGFATEA